MIDSSGQSYSTGWWFVAPSQQYACQLKAIIPIRTIENKLHMDFGSHHQLAMNNESIGFNIGALQHWRWKTWASFNHISMIIHVSDHCAKYNQWVLQWSSYNQWVVLPWSWLWSFRRSYERVWSVIVNQSKPNDHWVIFANGIVLPSSISYHWPPVTITMHCQLINKPLSISNHH